MTIPQERVRELCELATRESGKSVSEDERAHPFVGAVLVDEDGRVLATSFRGESPKRHAEFSLLEKAAAKGFDLTRCSLFVTLEPCVKRGPDKVPCAVRVADAGIREVYIGMLDPDPRITGRGEMYLTYQGIAVDHFPRDIADKLRTANKEFFDRFRAAHFWEPAPPSLYGAEVVGAGLRPRAALTREGILYQTLDLMVGSSGPIWISAGDLSWLRELQIALLGAALDGRDIRLLQHSSTNNIKIATTANHLGASVVHANPGQARFTLVNPGTADAATVVVEDSHALLLRSPDEAGLLEILATWFGSNWNSKAVSAALPVRIDALASSDVIAALRTYVRQYKTLRIQLEDVDLNILRPATRSLELFKLFRIHQFAALRMRRELPEFCRVLGSPWPLISPPVVERLPDGSLVIVDGTHRSYSARARGENTIRAIVVDNPNFDLPSQPAQGWREVDILPEKLPREQRYNRFDPALFRPIRAAYESLAQLG